MAILLAATLVTGNTGYAQAAQGQSADRITESVVNEVDFVLQTTDKQQSKAVVQAKNKKKNAKKNRKAHLAYEKQLQKTKKEIAELIPYPDSVYFAYSDINGDGIDECIILGEYIQDGKNKMKIDLGSNMMAVYTYYNGKVNNVLYALCGGNGMSGFVNLKQKCLYGFCHTSSAEYSFSKIKLKNGKAKAVATYESIPLYNKNGGPKCDKNGMQICKYTVNGKKISKKKFEKIANTALSTNAITMYKVTKKNMKKLR